MRAALALVLLAGCPKVAPPTLVPAEALMAATSDGWVLPVRHYPAEGPPVLLVHGMGANHYNFDYREEVSLAWALQQRGFDVWVPELRGDPGARAPDDKLLREIDFDQYALRDMPAVVDAVLKATGEQDLYWVGHSMGGMLLYAALTEHPEQVRAGVAICSPGVLETKLPVYGTVGAFQGLLGRRGRIPAKAMAAAAAPMGKLNPLVARLANPANMDPNVLRGLSGAALTDLPKPLAHQALSWAASGAVTREDGSPWLVPSETPLLLLGAADDRIVAEPDVAATCARYPDCTYVRLGMTEGFSLDYGHVDPVLGISAPSEVYPLVWRFLEAHARAEAGLGPGSALEAGSDELSALAPLPWQ